MLFPLSSLSNPKYFPLCWWPWPPAQARGSDWVRLGTQYAPGYNLANLVSSWVWSESLWIWSIRPGTTIPLSHFIKLLLHEESHGWLGTRNRSPSEKLHGPLVINVTCFYFCKPHPFAAFYRKIGSIWKRDMARVCEVECRLLERHAQTHAASPKSDLGFGVYLIHT